ncbi:MAG: cell envelope biosis protein OmpA [Rhodospirillales bacterium]|nr:cell envelope biosis protein OmpA [Rhodospirillales bacterium]
MSTCRMGFVVMVLALAGCTMMKPRPAQTALIFFRPWSADLTPEAKVIVDQAAAKVKTTTPSTVAVAGYTYNDASPEENLRLAKQRVKTVETALITDGVDPKLLLSLPLGAPNDSAGMTGDRRIEIRLTY